MTSASIVQGNVRERKLVEERVHEGIEPLNDTLIPE